NVLDLRARAAAAGRKPENDHPANAIAREDRFDSGFAVKGNGYGRASGVGDQVPWDIRSDRFAVQYLVELGQFALEGQVGEFERPLQERGPGQKEGTEGK